MLANIPVTVTVRKLHAPVGKSFPLAQAAEAHKFLEDNTLHKAGTLVGKVIVEI